MARPGYDRKVLNNFGFDDEYCLFRGLPYYPNYDYVLHPSLCRTTCETEAVVTQYWENDLSLEGLLKQLKTSIS